jgi:hypothetical protein
MAQTPPPALGSCSGESATFSGVKLPAATLADGEPLPAGSYDVRVTSRHPAPAVGQSPEASCWIEFVSRGTVLAREVASVIGAGELAAIAKTPPPSPGSARVDVLKGGEYVRVWLNHKGTHYLVNLAVAR